MRIQGFVCTWKEHEAQAQALEEKVGKLIEVTVINSEEYLEDEHPAWVHLDETAYFSAHWNKAVELFDADIFFQIQADAEFDQFKALFAKARLLFGKYELGVYEPNVEHTRIQYDKLALRPIEPDVFEVPKPDSICWFITKEVVRQLPPVDVTVNKYGFGVVSAIAALSQSSGKRCVRDYGFTVLHPKHRGYSTLLAKQQKEVYLEGLNPNLRAGTIQVDQRAFSARLRRKHRD